MYYRSWKIRLQTQLGPLSWHQLYQSWLINQHSLKNELGTKKTYWTYNERERCEVSEISFRIYSTLTKVTEITLQTELLMYWQSYVCAGFQCPEIPLKNRIKLNWEKTIAVFNCRMVHPVYSVKRLYGSDIVKPLHWAARLRWVGTSYRVYLSLLISSQAGLMTNEGPYLCRLSVHWAMYLWSLESRPAGNSEATTRAVLCCLSRH